MAQTDAAQAWTDAGSSGLDLGIFSVTKIGDVFLKLLVAILVVWLLVFLSKILTSFITKRVLSNSIVDDEYTKKVSNLVGEIIFYTLLIISILIGFTIVGIDFSWILWWISFGIGFAFKDILGNLIAGILVLTNKEFKLGDIIVIDDDPNEYFGRIEEITIRYTVVRTFDLRKAVIPNLTLITKPVRTFDSEDIVRLDIDLTVHYSTDMTTLSKKVVESVNKLEMVKEKDSTRVSVVKLGDHGIECKIYFYFDPNGGVLIPTAKSIVNNQIMEMFRKEGFVIPYPHQTLTVDYNDKNLLGSMIYVAKEVNKEAGKGK